MKHPVKNYMTALPQTIGENATLKKAKDLMDELGCRHLPVLNGGQLVGVISYYDLSLVVLTTKGLNATVKDVMSTAPYVAEPDTAIQDVALNMLEQRVNSAIISAKGNDPWGIFTSTDALKVIAQGN